MEPANKKRVEQYPVEREEVKAEPAKPAGNDFFAMLARAQEEELAKAKEAQAELAPPHRDGALWRLKGRQTSEINKIIKNTNPKPKKHARSKSKDTSGGMLGGVDLDEVGKKKRDKTKKKHMKDARPETVGGVELVHDTEGNVIVHETVGTKSEGYSDSDVEEDEQDEDEAQEESN